MVKMNTDDYTPRKGITPDLAAQYAAWMADLGGAALEVSSWTYYTFHTVRGDVPIDDLARALPWWIRPMAKVIFKRQVFPCRFQRTSTAVLCRRTAIAPSVRLTLAMG